MRPGSADAARGAMGGSPCIVMSPLHVRRGARGDGCLGPPSRDDQELREVCRQIAELAPQKFSSVREAFRYLRPDHNGRVSRSEVCYFFRAYGVERLQADRVFAYFDPSESDDIDCQEFIEFFRQQIHPDDEPGLQDGTGDVLMGSSTPGSPAAALNAAAVDLQCAKIANQFHEVLEQVREKAPQRFSHVRETLRIVDSDYDGCITQSEMRNFFRVFGFDDVVADSFFKQLAKGGPGGANYHTFVQVVGPFLDLPGVVAASKPPSRLLSARSRPHSARSRPSSRGRPSSAEKRLLDNPGRPEGPRDVLESALSGGRIPCLPALARGSKPSGSGSSVPQALASPRVALSRAGTPSLAGNSPRLPLSACSDRSKARERSSSVRERPGDCLPRQLERVFEPAAPPPAAARPGRRPMGIQRMAPTGDDKIKEFNNGVELTADTSARNEVLLSGGRPIASPLARFRRRA